jgi:DNA polymerase-3 subunit chi
VPDFQQTILIGSDSAPENWQSLILNLSLKYPENISQIQRILEILDNNEAVKQPGRKRYQLYNKAGFNLTTHNP